MSSKHIADTGFFVALGAPSNERYQRVRAFAEHNELTFLIPERVYDELTEASSSEQFETEPIPIDIVIDEGWSCVADPLEYTDPLVSKAMDGVQRYISNADDRPEDTIERTDSALGGLAAQLLVSGTATHVYLYTTDTAAGDGVNAILENAGYGDSVTVVDGFQFIEDLLDVD